MPNTEITSSANYSKGRSSSLGVGRKPSKSSSSSFSPATVSFYKFIRNYDGSRINPSRFFELPAYVMMILSSPGYDPGNFSNFVALPRTINYT